MKKHSFVLLVVLLLMLSGAAGFGGAYVAINLTNPVETVMETENSTKKTSQGMTEEQLQGYLNTYLSENFASFMIEYGEILNYSEDVPSTTTNLNSSDGNAMTDFLTTPEIAALTSDSVVEIYTETVSSSMRLGQFVTEGAGSGVIITENGYIVTNNHVIEDANRITVRLSSGVEYDAGLIGRDSVNDLAVVKINATGLHPAVYGDSDDLVVGEIAVAIGNPLGKLGGTVSEGIISALSRNIDIDGNTMSLLQTTAAVNPGNSGGGLFNRFGELIGIVNAKSSGSDIEGLGFAIPINTVKSITDDLIRYGYIPGRIDLGATLIDILDTRTAMVYRVQTFGVYVLEADFDAGLQRGDRIVSVNGADIESIADIDEILDSCSVGDDLQITVVRNGRSITVIQTLKQAMS